MATSECPRCGNPITAGQKFCNSCGYAVTAADTAASMPPAGPGPAQSTPILGGQPTQAFGTTPPGERPTAAFSGAPTDGGSSQTFAPASSPAPAYGGPPAGAPPSYGAPAEGGQSYGAPATGGPPSYGPPAAAAPNYGAPAGAPPNYGPPAGGEGYIPPGAAGAPGYPPVGAPLPGGPGYGPPPVFPANAPPPVYPATAYPAPVVARSRPRWVLPLVGCLVLGVLACAGFFGVTFFAVNGLTSDMANTGEQFMSRLRDGQYDQAYALCTPDLQGQLGTALQFGQAVAGVQPASWSFNSRSVNNNTGNLSGTAKLKDGRDATLELVLDKISNTWRLSGVHITPK